MTKATTVKIKCAYHTNAVLYGTIGALINLIKLALHSVKYCTTLFTVYPCMDKYIYTWLRMYVLQVCKFM